MEMAPEQAGTLYIDGHVRVYNGHQTRLPRHYVARQKLCLRATSDYWINALDGQPLFVVHQAVDPGMIKVIEREILPRLKKDVPNQPGEQALAQDPLLHRFTLRQPDLVL
jgi:homospermidine synthase